MRLQNYGKIKGFKFTSHAFIDFFELQSFEIEGVEKDGRGLNPGGGLTCLLRSNPGGAEFFLEGLV